MYIDDLDLFILKTITTNKKLALEFINECDTALGDQMIGRSMVQNNAMRCIFLQ